MAGVSLHMLKTRVVRQKEKKFAVRCGAAGNSIVTCGAVVVRVQFLNVVYGAVCSHRKTFAVFRRQRLTEFIVLTQVTMTVLRKTSHMELEQPPILQGLSTRTDTLRRAYVRFFKEFAEDHRLILYSRTIHLLNARAWLTFRMPV